MIDNSALSIVSQPFIVVERLFDVAQFIYDWEQCRKMNLYALDGSYLGRFEETTGNFGTSIVRQVAKKMRPFKVKVFNQHNHHVLTFKRSFTPVRSYVKCLTPDGTLIGESRQKFHVWKRQYNIYVNRDNDVNKEDLPPSYQDPPRDIKTSNGVDASNPETAIEGTDHDPSVAEPVDESQLRKFGVIDSKVFTYNFSVSDAKDMKTPIATIDRNWKGFIREYYTDTGVYSINFAPVVDSSLLGFAERAVLLATTFSIDFDHFSPRSR